jgi:hypothetical protein
MEKEIDIIYWNNIKSIPKQKYPILTNSDLVWRHSTQKDLMEMIAAKLGKTRPELELEIETF